MEGCARRERRQVELALATGWHAANFTRTERLKDLDHYLKLLGPAREPTASELADEAASIFATFAERGLVKIREVPRDRSGREAATETEGMRE